MYVKKIHVVDFGNFEYLCYNVGVTGQLLYWIMWEAVRRLEEMNLKVNFGNNYSEYAIHDVL